MTTDCIEASRIEGIVALDNHSYEFFIDQRVELIGKEMVDCIDPRQKASKGATGVVTSIGKWSDGRHFLRVTWDKGNPNWHGYRDGGIRNGDPAIVFKPISNNTCVYCGEIVEYTNKYFVCTECYRVQE